MNDKPKLIGMLGEEQPPAPPESKLNTAMLPEIGDQVVGVIKTMGVESPGVILLVLDCDTGEISSSTNLKNEDMLNVLMQVLQKNETETGQ